MNYKDLKDYVKSNQIDEILKKTTCKDDVSKEKERYLNLLEEAYKLYGDGDYHFISSPGRSEIGGNHTDHQHGRVLACGLNIGNVCVVKKTDDNIATFLDRTFKINDVDLKDLDIHQEELNSSAALIRGVASRLNQLGYKFGGFKALCDSNVLVGSGISSSACFEVMLVEIYNALYNDEKITPVERAIISQYAENVYFGKPCGLMDQMAISVGGFTAIDFKDPAKPIIENRVFSFSDYSYEMMLVNTKGDHADLSHEYAAVPGEIKEVANLMGVDYLRDKEPSYFYDNITSLREKVKNDRAILRCYHFYNEDKRADDEKKAVEKKDINGLLKLMNASGNSSFKYLQNVYPASRPSSQALSLGLAIAEKVLDGEGACRVHGGGFDGTIQVVVPNNKIGIFKKEISAVFGDDAVLEVRVREFGTKLVI